MRKRSPPVSITLPPPPMLPREAAERLGVGEDTVLGWIHAGELVATNLAAAKNRKTGKRVRPRWRIFEDQIQAFIKLRSNSAPLERSRRREKREPVPEYVK